MKLKKSGGRLTMRQKRAITGYVFLLPFIIGFLFFILSPLISSIRMSLSEVKLNATGGFTMKFIGLENYIRALAVDKDFNRLLTESITSLLIDVPCIIIVSLVLAVLLKRKFPGRGAVRAIFFMPVILASGVVLGMEKSNALLTGIQDMQAASSNTSITGVVGDLLLGGVGSSAASGIVNTILGIIDNFYDIVISSSIQTVIFLSALQTINPSIYEAAETEGCSAWESFWKITLPMISPMILVNWIYTIIDRFTRSDNELMVKILDAIGVTMEFGFSSAMAWIYCLCMLALIGISSLIISRMVYYYD